MNSMRNQRGAAALLVTMLLFFAMVLVSMYANRNLVFEQRSSANQYRSTQAFEAAEAGIEWALAQLNSNQRIGVDCVSTSDPAALSFRARYLKATPANASFSPVTWNNGAGAAALQSSCVRSGDAWSCSCPVSGPPLLAQPTASASGAAFILQFVPTAKPGVVRLTAIGCTSLGGACTPSALAGTNTSATIDATAKVEVVLGLLAGLRTPPAAPITTRGAFDADTASLAVRNTDPTTGIAIHAGAAIAASNARLTLPAGAPRFSALASDDTALAGMSADQFFVSHFGLDKTRWKQQPGVETIACNGDCGDAIAAAAAAAPDSPLIWVEGDLTLSRPLTLGTLQRPAVIIVNGTVRIDGAVTLNGVIYGTAMSWNAAGGSVHGAAIVETSYRGIGTPEFIYDTSVLTSLSGNSGSFARVNGSWRDF